MSAARSCAERSIGEFEKPAHDVGAAGVNSFGVLGLFAQTDVSPHPSQWGPIGPRADFLDAPESVSELADDLVLGRFDALLG